MRDGQIAVGPLAPRSHAFLTPSLVSPRSLIFAPPSSSPLALSLLLSFTHRHTYTHKRRHSLSPLSEIAPSLPFPQLLSIPFLSCSLLTLFSYTSTDIRFPSPGKSLYPSSISIYIFQVHQSRCPPPEKVSSPFFSGIVSLRTRFLSKSRFDAKNRRSLSYPGRSSFAGSRVTRGDRWNSRWRTRRSRINVATIPRDNFDRNDLLAFPFFSPLAIQRGRPRDVLGRRGARTPDVAEKLNNSCRIFLRSKISGKSNLRSFRSLHDHDGEDRCCHVRTTAALWNAKWRLRCVQRSHSSAMLVHTGKPCRFTFEQSARLDDGVPGTDFFQIRRAKQHFYARPFSLDHRVSGRSNMRV